MQLFKKSFIVLIFLSIGVNFSCEELEQSVDIDLPPVEKQLAIECYLEIGKPYQLLLTETKSYFDDLDECPFVRNAIVVITHNGQKDTLKEAPFINNNCDINDPVIPYGFIPYINEDTTRFFNYGSNVICPADYNSPFMIEVWDTVNNRYATATSQFLPIVPINVFETEFNSEGKAYCLFGCQDDPNAVNFYRMMLHETSLKKYEDNSPIPVARNPRTDGVIDDVRIFDGKQILRGTSYRYEVGDTLIATIYHIDKDYHDHLETTRDAASSNGNPFGQPTVIISNIQGGEGVFTCLSYDRDTLIVQ